MMVSISILANQKEGMKTKLFLNWNGCSYWSTVNLGYMRQTFLLAHTLLKIPKVEDRFDWLHTFLKVHNTLKCVLIGLKKFLNVLLHFMDETPYSNITLYIAMLIQ